jgi:HlyD family secretion protein
MARRADPTPIFRSAALEALGVPEQLDELVRRTPYSAWFFLAPLIALVGGLIAWSVLGMVSVVVTGGAVLVDAAGVVDARADTGGRVAELSVTAGTHVHAGQRIAHLVQPELTERLAREDAQLVELQAQQARQRAAREATERAAGLAAEQQRASVQQQLRLTHARVATLRTRLATQEQLLAEGLVTAQQVAALRNDIDATGAQIASLDADLRELEVQRQSRARDALQEAAAMESSAGQLSREVTALRDQVATLDITAPVAGRVVQVLGSIGEPLAPGQVLAVIERFEDSGSARTALSVQAFVPLSDSKKIAVGMEARIVPATVVREEGGYLIGTVSRVSPYPIGAVGLQLALKNAALARAFEQQGPVSEVRISLQSARTVSGYRWSMEAPHTPPQSGTPATVEVVVRRLHPVELLVPLARRLLRGQTW